MQINSTLTVPFLPVSASDTSSTKSTATATTSANAATETPTLQITSPTFSALVEEAKSYPEVRSEVVAAYAAQVASGHYPPAVVISGLADLLSDAS
jgi:anti-sigma28 factor (negative regulator of flagellin synthesis)